MKTTQLGVCAGLFLWALSVVLAPSVSAAEHNQPITVSIKALMKYYFKIFFFYYYFFNYGVAGLHN